MTIFIDTCIPMYAAGSEHPFKQSCQDILKAVASAKLEAYTDAEVFQEILYRYFSIDRKQIGLQIFDQFSKIMDGAIIPVHFFDLSLARKLSEKESCSHLSPRDLIHLAIMINNGISRIITTDQGFANISDIQVVNPSR